MKASFIIPTFGRSEDVLIKTLTSLFELGDEFWENVQEIFLIDQNRHPLALEDWFKDKPRSFLLMMQYLSVPVWPGDPLTSLENLNQKRERGTIPLYHLCGLPPSVTVAKNYACQRASGSFLIFLDDDVSVQKGALHLHLTSQKMIPQAGMLGGRETIDPPQLARPWWKNILVGAAESLMGKREEKYKVDGRYIGRITPESLFFCSFDVPWSPPVEVDTVRGCNASLKKDVYDKVGGFDENFQGTALREETDFCLRITKAGYTNYYLGEARVFHRRQLGGCNNLGKNYRTFLSKMECELYFQYKHFLKVNPFFFFLRLIPHALEALRWSWGMGFFFLFQFVIQFWRIQDEEPFREAYRKSLPFSPR